MVCGNSIGEHGLTHEQRAHRLTTIHDYYDGGDGRSRAHARDQLFDDDTKDIQSRSPLLRAPTRKYRDANDNIMPVTRPPPLAFPARRFRRPRAGGIARRVFEFSPTSSFCLSLSLPPSLELIYNIECRGKDEHGVWQQRFDDDDERAEYMHARRRALELVRARFKSRKQRRLFASIGRSERVGEKRSSAF